MPKGPQLSIMTDGNTWYQLTLIFSCNPGGSMLEHDEVCTGLIESGFTKQ